jgi:hypothetical protein
VTSRQGPPADGAPLDGADRRVQGRQVEPFDEVPDEPRAVVGGADFVRVWPTETGAPPGTTPGGRYGLLPLLGDRLLKGAVILLDARRLDKQGVLQRWEKEAGWRYTIKDSGTTAYAVVTV